MVGYILSGMLSYNNVPCIPGGFYRPRLDLAILDLGGESLSGEIPRGSATRPATGNSVFRVVLE